jgi:hypothetical protein
MAEQQHHVFRPERTHLLAAIIMILLSLFIIGSDLLYLFWLPLLPVVFIMWVVRAHTIVDDTGITAHPAFAQPTTTDWADIAGIGFGRSQAFLQTKEGKKITLPGVTFNSLPQLEAASAGRIPDALTQGRQAADDKVVIVHKDGWQVLVDKQEYERFATEDVDKQAKTDSD